MRIGIITHNYPIKSSESKDAGKFVYSFAHELSKKAEVFVLCPDFGGKKEKQGSVQVKWFSWSGSRDKFGSWGLLSPLSLFKFIKLVRAGNQEVIKFVEEKKIEYLLCFWNFPSGIWGLYANKRLGTRYSTWALGSDIYIYPKLPIARQIIQLVLKQAENRFGNSADIGRLITKISGKEYKFLPTSNPVLSTCFKRPKLDKKCFNFLCIARLERVKGPDILIEAAKLLKDYNEKFTITIIGSGSMHERLIKKVSEYQLGQQVNILGYIEDQELVNGYLKYCDALIVPSRSESFPLVVTEAIQTNLPIIGSDVGDLPSFIGKNKIGFYFKKNNITGLVIKMKKMMNIGKEMRRSKRKVMKKLSEQFKLEYIVDEFLYSVRQYK